MKNFYLFLICLGLTSFSYGQYESLFENGTLEGWTNTDTSTTGITIEETGLPFEGDQFMLQKLSDGSNSSEGELAIINTTDDWIGSYPNGDFDAFAWVDMYMKNENDFDLYLRMGYMGGSDNSKMVHSQPFVIPANSDWNYVNFDAFGPFTVVEGTSSYDEIFADSHEVKILHSSTISYEGEHIVGTINISEIFSAYLLGIENQELQKAQLFPNPVNSNLTVLLPNVSEAEMELYNILGELVWSQKLENIQSTIDFSVFQSGIYLVKISSETETITKKIVKY